MPGALGAVMAIALLVVTPGWSADLDLDLDARPEQVLRVSDVIENPHDLPCWSCHEGDTGGSVENDYNLRKDRITLCKDCHPDSNLHPVGVTPTSVPGEEGKVWLPMGTGPLKGQVVCTTCHYIHATEYHRHILRGDSGRGSRREAICSACHGNRLLGKSPHTDKANACLFCHMSPPSGGQDQAGTLRADVLNRCDFCHNTLNDGHYLAVNPFSDPSLRAAVGSAHIPLQGGRYTCISCHDPHDAANRRKKMLRPAYLEMAARSNRVNPHWKDIMCVACHDGEATSEDPRLLFGGDINQLCSRCHDGQVARRDIHPVGVAPTEKVSIPAGFPLTEGVLTCSTCHQSSLQEGGESLTSVRRFNPNFLRGTQMTRNEFCFSCHIQEYYGQLDAHEQINDDGSVREQSCLFCHSSLPNVKVLGIDAVGFSDDSLEDYCVWCHRKSREDYWENHPKGPHLVEPSREILKAIQTSVERIGVNLPLYQGRITCATCHNPHQAGVLEVDAAAKGVGGQSRLRLSAGMWLCVGCHVDKGAVD